MTPSNPITTSNPTTPSNPIIPSNTTQRLIEMLLERDASGQRKYNHTLDRSDLLCEDWAQHAIEESLDRAGYLLRMVDTAATLRAENIELAEENAHLRSMILPLVRFAKTLDIEPTPQAEAPVVEAPVHNILTDDKMLCQVSSVSEPKPIAAPAVAPAAPIGMTAREIATATGYHKDSVNNWGRKGLLPTPIEGTGTHPHNPPRYILDLDELRTKVEAYQDAAKGVRDKAILGAVARTATGLTRKQLAQRLGCDDTSVANYEKRGFITPIEGTGTSLKNPRLYRTSDISGLKAKIKELQASKGSTISKVLAESRAKAQAAPTPKDEEIETPEIIVEPRPAPQLSEATKHDYHWRNALPVLEAAIEKAEAEGEAILEIAYQTSPDNYQDRGSFVARPFGQLGPGLMAFVRATQESGKWSLTVPLRVESWIKPMAEGLVAYWRGATRSFGDTPRLPLADSPTRSLQA
jgi:hypothetical protein